MRFFILTMCLFFATYSLAKDDLTLIATTDNPENSFHVKTLRKFSELLDIYSYGRIKTRIHYRGSTEHPAIMGEEVNVRMLTYGNSGVHTNIHITIVASGNVSHRAKILEFLMLPYLFKSKSTARSLFSDELMMKKINEILASKHNIRALGWLIGDFRHLTNSIRPIENLSDLKGLRIRTPINTIMHKTYDMLGARAIPLAWSETFNALKNKRLDGQENPYSVIVDSKFWQAGQKYLVDNGTFLWTAPILISESYFQSLSPDNQQAITLAAKDATRYQWQLPDLSQTEHLNILEKNGFTLTTLKDKPQWIKRTQMLWPEYYSIIGYGDHEKGKQLVNEVLAIVQ